MPLPSSTDLSSQIAHFVRCSVTDLRTEWVRVFGAAPPKNAQREYILRAITYRLQCEAYSGLSPALMRTLRKLSSGMAAPNAPIVGPTQTLQSGARILREWKGDVHEVEVVDGGYRYNDETYKSLSVIARQITGTRWSGPKFFGLKHPKPVMNRAF